METSRKENFESMIEIVNEILPDAKIIKLKGWSRSNGKQDYDNAKIPVGKTWEQFESESDITRWVNGAKGWIGAVIPENRIIIDVDDNTSGELVKQLLDKEGIRHHCIKTPRGYQFVFKASEKITKTLKQATKFFTQIGVVIDTRNTGKGYIVFPTENTENRFILSQNDELDELPFFLRPLKQMKPKTHKNYYEFPIPMMNGSRDNDLYHFAAHLNSWGVPREEAEKSCLLIYEYFMLDKTDFSEKQALEKVRSGYNWKPEKTTTPVFGIVSEDGKIIPEPFYIKGNSLYKTITTKDGIETEIEVSRFAPSILKEFYNIERNNVHFEITWKNRGKEQHEVVPANIIAIKKDLLSLAEKGFSCNDLNSKDLIMFFDRYLAVNEVEQSYMVERLGHIEKAPFIHPLQSNGIEIVPNDLGEKQLLEGFQVAGSVESWKTEVFDRIKQHPKVLLYTLASFASITLKDLKVDPFIIEISGSTSQGKTTAMQIARSVHGTEKLINQWDATRVAIERKAGFLNSFPLFMDDTRKANEKIIQPVIYSFSGGRAKGRGSLKGSQKETTWNNILFSTGEVAITEYARQAGGASARVISLVDEPFVNVDAEYFNQLYKALEANYGAVGLEFIELWEKEKENLIPEFHKFRKLYLEKSSGNEVLTRLSMYYATVHFVGSVLKKFFQFEVNLQKLVYLFEEMARENKAIDKPKQLLEELLLKLDANRKYIADSIHTPDTIWAIYKGGTICFTPDFLKQELGFEEKLIRKEWLKRGFTLTQLNRDKEVDYKRIKNRYSTFIVVTVNKEVYESFGVDFEVDYESIGVKNV